MPFGVDDAIAIGSLITGIISKKKKANEAKKVAATNAANTAKYRTDSAARQDQLDLNNTDLANQESAAAERTRTVKSKLVQSLLNTLLPTTLDKSIAEPAIAQNTQYNPIKRAAPPKNLVAPIDMEADPNVGGGYDMISNALLKLGQTRKESKTVRGAEAARQEELSIYEQLFGNKKPKVTSSPALDENIYG